MGAQSQFGDYVNKVPVRTIIQTTKQILIGTVYIQTGFRIKDVLNRADEEFVAVTQASFGPDDEKVEFILLQKKEIVWIATDENMDPIVKYLFQGTT